jgi:hypothetical protein
MAMRITHDAISEVIQITLRSGVGSGNIRVSALDLVGVIHVSLDLISVCHSVGGEVPRAARNRARQSHIGHHRRCLSPSRADAGMHLAGGVLAGVSIVVLALTVLDRMLKRQ